MQHCRQCIPTLNPSDAPALMHALLPTFCVLLSVEIVLLFPYPRVAGSTAEGWGPPGSWVALHQSVRLLPRQVWRQQTGTYWLAASLVRNWPLTSLFTISQKICKSCYCPVPLESCVGKYRLATITRTIYNCCAVLSQLSPAADSALDANKTPVVGLHHTSVSITTHTITCNTTTANTARHPCSHECT